MDSAIGAEAGDGIEQVAVRVPGGADHELHGHARGATGVERVPGLSIGQRLPLADDQPADLPKCVERSGETLVGRDLGQARAAGGLEVE